MQLIEYNQQKKEKNCGLKQMSLTDWRREYYSLQF